MKTNDMQRDLNEMRDMVDGKEIPIRTHEKLLVQYPSIHDSQSTNERLEVAAERLKKFDCVAALEGFKMAQFATEQEIEEA